MILDIICVILLFLCLIWLMMVSLFDLIPGDRVRLIDFGAIDASFRRRLLSQGLTRGVEIKIIRTAPLGCPVQIDVRGTALTLRKEEASCLLWERI